MVSDAVLPTIRALPGVDAAAGGIGGDFKQTSLSLAAADGGSSPAARARPSRVGVDPEHPRFIPLTLEEGAWPHGAEVVLDEGTADQEHLAVGDTIDGHERAGRGDATASPASARSATSRRSAATVAIFDLPTAQRLLRKEGFDSISVAAKPGTSVDALVRQIEPTLPSTLQVESSSARAEEAQQEVSKFVGYLRWALLAFGGIALFVGAFVIFNTLSITIAQRTRELATLRTLGASRRQVLRSVLVETLAIGVLASLSGLALGAGLARGLSALFGALGLALPQADLVVAPRTIVASLTVGIVVTVLAGFMPAIRATRVAPIAAVREGAAPPPSRSRRHVPLAARRRARRVRRAPRLGPVLRRPDVAGRLAAIAGGTVGAFLAVGMLAPRLVRPLAAHRRLARPAAGRRRRRARPSQRGPAARPHGRQRGRADDRPHPRARRSPCSARACATSARDASTARSRRLRGQFGGRRRPCPPRGRAARSRRCPASRPPACAATRPTRPARATDRHRRRPGDDRRVLPLPLQRRRRRCRAGQPWPTAARSSAAASPTRTTCTSGDAAHGARRRRGGRSTCASTAILDPGKFDLDPLLGLGGHRPGSCSTPRSRARPTCTRS